MNSLYDISFRSATGELVSLGDFRGKVLLLVNTATQCGLAPQFRELEALQKEYAELVVIGFPSDQFAQEPETNDTVARVCELNFGVTFLLSEKIEVNGPNTHPVFMYLKTHSRSMLGKDIKWNFTKFLVSRNGEQVLRFAPTTAPSALRPKIEAMLRQN